MDNDSEESDHHAIGNEEQELGVNAVVAAAFALYQRATNDILPTVVATVTHAIYFVLQREVPTPYHTSILTGQIWVQELLEGHPERIRSELGVHKSVFRILVSELQAAGYHGIRDVTLEEQLAIFLWTCVTGTSVQHVGERFQRSNETITKYFKLMLGAFSSAQIYHKYVRLPSIGDPTPTAIAEDPRFWPYFKDAIGAIGGTHIPCISSARNRRGFTSQNCLVCCDFDMKFTYVLSGWEGPAANATVHHDVPINELAIPPGKYYLADADFAICSELLVPYHGERYHLAEWGPGQIQPVNHREYFNLRHSQLRNVVERIISVLKRRFMILTVPPEFDMGTQAQIPIACCCIHNIIRTFDSAELEDMEDVTQPLDEPGPGVYGSTAQVPLQVT